MAPRTLRILRGGSLAALVVGYGITAHAVAASIEAGHVGNFTLLFALAPVALLAAIAAWRAPVRPLALAALALGAALLWALWPHLLQRIGIISWLEHVTMQVILMALFGSTLLTGKVPMCTRFARAVHAPEPLTADEDRYARRVTVAWTLFFAAMALTSTLLFLMLSLPAWSIFANFLTLPLLALMFAVEYRVRRWALPHTRPRHIMDTVRAFRTTASRTR